MTTSQQKPPVTVYLKDYRAPDYGVDNVELRFDLGEETTRVHARLHVISQYDRTTGVRPLVLDGHDLMLKSVTLDGRLLRAEEYTLGPTTLIIPRPPALCTVEIETEIRPQDNTSLMGLYKSSGNFCTQCEAQGFRTMTYFLDRPDVMARYTTTIVADRIKYPVLLSNGNRVTHGTMDGQRHYATWHDPFPKPSYLFALVAGDLARIEDAFVTRSGRKVQLHMFVQQHNAHKCQHAMASLKKAMHWDEVVYGCEYDLDVYMIVAVDDFNMGAMENKGLNVFNSKYVLAQPETATDMDYQGIEGVIGHEYFHNWSGNRVTCRDWFQLSLKEGFTVFRDQEFSADMGSRGVKRIQDVNALRSHQFREDAGPMAHPVRPPSYVEINNFYTMTVYNKGAEVVRMLQGLLGAPGFRKGTDLYFSCHDGQAVTTDDFVAALEDANATDLSQFRRWYSQAGTPVLHIQRAYAAAERTYTLRVRQSCPATPGQEHKQPFHIPLAVGLLDAEGQDMPLRLAGETTSIQGTRVLPIRNADETFIFIDVPHAPVPSLLRGFSAPVKIEIDLTDAERCFLMGHDSDAFNRWEAGQQLAIKILLQMINAERAGQPLVVDAAFIAAMGKSLHTEGSHGGRTENRSCVFSTSAISALVPDSALPRPSMDSHGGRSDGLDQAMIAQVLTLPSESYLAEFMPVIDPQAIHNALHYMRRSLAQALSAAMFKVYEASLDTGPYNSDAQAMGRRSLKNVCLGYLMELEDPQFTQRCVQQFRNADNMTDTMAALHALVNTDGAERTAALAAFYEQWRDDALVMDKWLAIQATSRLPTTLDAVRALTTHPVFNVKNPNKVRALIGSFCHANPACFHAANGEGYRFIGDFIRTLDPINPQVAARLVAAFSLWRRYDPPRQAHMREQLQTMLDTPRLSRDVYEIVSKSLADSAV